VKKETLLFNFFIINLVVFILIAPLVIFYGPFASLKIFTLETIITSRHPQVAEFFLSKEKISQLLKQSNSGIITVEPVIMNKKNVLLDNSNGIRIEEISGKSFKGKVMLIDNPNFVRIAVTNELGVAGQRLSELVIENKAIGGINAGGFFDPNAQGNGAFPDGITVQNGEIIYNNVGNKYVSIIGLDKNGVLILEEMSVKEIKEKEIQHAVTFQPYLLLNGIPQIEGDGGWGLAPRTGIGQRSDGTIIFVVIDGRQPGWSMGATLRDLMNVFIEYQALNAANLDGGSSTEMYYNGQIINRLWNVFGERYMPTAFIVVLNDEQNNKGETD